MMKRVVVPAILAVSAAVLFVTPAVAQSDKPAKPGMSMGDAPATQPSGKLTKVDSPKRVCMVTNKAFADDQIAVDKADAVIAADSKGKVFYFENDENLAAYNAKVAK
jgi:hypothetical protein